MMSNWKPLGVFHGLVLLIARVVYGMVFLYYGLPKVQDLEANAQDFEEMGFRPGWLWGTPVALLETVGSLAIIKGVFTWFFALGFAIHMTTGMWWKITRTSKKFSDWSYDLLLWVLSLVFLAFGR